MTIVKRHKRRIGRKIVTVKTHRRKRKSKSKVRRRRPKITSTTRFMGVDDDDTSMYPLTDGDQEDVDVGTLIYVDGDKPTDFVSQINLKKKGKTKYYESFIENKKPDKEFPLHFYRFPVVKDPITKKTTDFLSYGSDE